MKTTLSNATSARGYALLMVLVFLGVSSLMLAGVMNWISTRARLNARQQTFQFAVSAAESAANMALSSMTRDFLTNNETHVSSRLDAYARMVPANSEHPAWNGVTFFDAAGTKERLTVARTETWRYGALRNRYQGLQGYYAAYRITAGAALDALPRVPVAAQVRYDLQLADIPVFAFQAYSAMDLEFGPAMATTVNGRIHANGNLYAAPNGVSLVFNGDVTAGGGCFPNQNPNDPVPRSVGSVSFRGKTDDRAQHLKLPLDTLHTPAVLRALIEPPPASEPPTSLIGTQRFFNKAELMISLSDSGFTVTSGRHNNFARSIAASVYTNFISTNLFYDKRESKMVRSIDLNVGRLADYALLLRLLVDREVKTVYLNNQLPAAPQSMNAVRLVNGQILPATGLTAASVNPVYILGNYNVLDAYRGSTNTSQTFPAAVVADAVTALSVNWKDNLGNSSITARKAASTTINAAIITGIVPTGGGFYSGGVENYLRLLEDWAGTTLTYNGAFAVFSSSASATAPWGALDDVYLPPTRQLSWDGNFANAAKLPPGTPFFRTVILAQYSILAAQPPP